ncbi:hypothetical protein CCUS01_06179 [Colletotrichum cuscutae]|uniref:Uncharacterized protein n=1 Tax=Colletotrichum cuscutae TaxID=1209917 RepID=A0AAI9Y1B9_9PEZI|nr:hypothetical protein CCUS01_06179 [Colletotrichum cuscutae]
MPRGSLFRMQSGARDIMCPSVSLDAAPRPSVWFMPGNKPLRPKITTLQLDWEGPQMILTILLKAKTDRMARWGKCGDWGKLYLLHNRQATSKCQLDSMPLAKRISRRMSTLNSCNSIILRLFGRMRHFAAYMTNMYAQHLEGFRLTILHWDPTNLLSLILIPRRSREIPATLQESAKPLIRAVEQDGMPAPFVLAGLKEAPLRKSGPVSDKYFDTHRDYRSVTDFITLIHCATKRNSADHLILTSWTFSSGPCSSAQLDSQEDLWSSASHDRGWKLLRAYRMLVTEFLPKALIRQIHKLLQIRIEGRPLDIGSMARCFQIRGSPLRLILSPDSKLSLARVCIPVAGDFDGGTIKMEFCCLKELYAGGPQPTARVMKQRFQVHGRATRPDKVDAKGKCDGRRLARGGRQDLDLATLPMTTVQEGVLAFPSAGSMPWSLLPWATFPSYLRFIFLGRDSDEVVHAKRAIHWQAVISTLCLLYPAQGG